MHLPNLALDGPSSQHLVHSGHASQSQYSRNCHPQGADWSGKYNSIERLLFPSPVPSSSSFAFSPLPMEKLKLAGARVPRTHCAAHSSPDPAKSNKGRRPAFFSLVHYSVRRRANSDDLHTRVSKKPLDAWVEPPVSNTLAAPVFRALGMNMAVKLA